MKGYKIFDADWKCRGFQYEVGKTYETKEKISLCNAGFHFCKKIEHKLGSSFIIENVLKEKEREIKWNLEKYL